MTLHNNEGSYLAHTQGKKHQSNLARRAAKDAKDSPIQPAPEKARVDIRKFVKIGQRPTIIGQRPKNTVKDRKNPVFYRFWSKTCPVNVRSPTLYKKRIFYFQNNIRKNKWSYFYV